MFQTQEEDSAFLDIPATLHPALPSPALVQPRRVDATAPSQPSPLAGVVSRRRSDPVTNRNVHVMLCLNQSCSEL
jgi:hypothetical protein